MSILNDSDIKKNQTSAQEKPPLVILTGPTAVGKTALSIKLARKNGGEIISADSMQVYRGMDIGSAKVTKEEMDGVPHYLIDVLEPDEEFHVVRFQQMAKQAIQEILSHGKIPILAGGTGFYIQAVLYDIDFSAEEDDHAYRTELERRAAAGETAALYAELKEVDPEAAEAIHANNVKRVIRALEYYHENGGRISEHNKKQHERTSAYNSAYFVLTDDRQAIYDRIDKRVDTMMDNGLVDEVKALKERGFTRDMVSMQGLGYKEMLDYLDGTISLEEAVYRIKRDSRHFAKRQLTWFRRERDVIWLDRRAFESDDAMLSMIIAELTKRIIYVRS